MVKSGFLVVDKPQGYTSHDVVARIRRFFQTKKVGHTGTLDPNVTGVLPLAIGKATRAIQYLESSKSYSATMTLGTETDTHDIWGQVVEKGPDHVSESVIRQVFEDFIGPQMQTPPMYSAVQVDGVRLHQLARAGKVIERPAKEIEIYRMEITEMDGGGIAFNVSCSAGTYIRQLIADMGRAMGTFAHLSALRRTQAGHFTLEQAHSLDQIESMGLDQRYNLLLPIDQAIDLARIDLPSQHAFALQNGQRIRVQEADQDALKVYVDGVFYGVASIGAGLLKIDKLFLED